MEHRMASTEKYSGSQFYKNQYGRLLDGVFNVYKTIFLNKNQCVALF
jgi:hypothetical protein